MELVFEGISLQLIKAEWEIAHPVCIVHGAAYVGTA